MPKFGGRPPKVTPDICKAVAEKVCKGLSLTHALALINQAIPLAHWRNALAKSPVLLAAYDKRCAELLEQVMDELDLCTLRTMPAKVWKIERRFPEHFAQPKSQGTNVQVTVNTCVGLSDEVQKRAALFVKRARVESEPKQIGNET